MSGRDLRLAALLPLALAAAVLRLAADATSWPLRRLA